MLFNNFYFKVSLLLGLNHNVKYKKSRRNLSMVLLLAVVSSWLSAVRVNALLNVDFYTFPVGVLLKDGQEFDYIVVGAGAGGAAAAARLALAGQEVLLIEAGGNPNILSKIPAAAMGLLGSNIDWQYKTIPNNVSCLSSVGQQCRFSRGKCLGGSTAINYMLYTRGNRHQDFVDITVPGWNYEDLKPYFLRYEGLQDLDKLPPSSIPYHNTTGPMEIEFFNDPHNPWHSRLIKSFLSLNFPLNRDVNAKSQIGVSKVIGYVRQGQRMSTARGFLAREDVKTSLKVAKNTLCTKVIVDENNIARGVTVFKDRSYLNLYARKEVILSAGAIGTPQILMLSGVGPKDHLESVGVPVKVDLPVGEGMRDHVLPLLILLVDKGSGVLEELKLAAATATELGELLLKFQGALTSNGLTDVTMFANTKCYDYEQRQLLNVSSDGSDCAVPNLQIINAYVPRNLVTLAKPLFKKAIGFNDDVVDQLSEANKDYAFIVVSPVLLSPRSQGWVRLASADPLARPAILANYLADERDVEEMVRFIGIVEHMVATRTFERHGATLMRLALPHCADTTQYWHCYVRHMTFSVYHAAGTAPLGRVLDARLRVRRVHRLRVADLAALPAPPRANTAAVAIAIGERVVDFLLEDNK